MSMVGGFPGLRELNRVPPRMPLNPMDRSTVVSIYPREIKETKCTLFPREFTVPAGNMKKLGILHVTSCSWWKEIDPEQPLLEIPVYSTSIAESIVRDYCNGMVGCDMTTAMPGLFYIAGAVDENEIKTKYAKALSDAFEKQKRWYQILIRMADTLWSRTNGNPIAISDLMRMAAHEMGQDTKEWMREIQMAELIRCEACGALKNPEFPVCASCKSVDMRHPKAASLKFAQ